MKKVLVLLLLMLDPFAALVNVDACGPFFSGAMFVYTMHPDLPLDSFAAGELGVLQPTYARSYLYVAYRYIAGAGFNAEEQRQLTRLWDERIHFTQVDTSANVKLWWDARAKVPGVAPPPSIDSFKTIDYQSFPNCAGDAFATAAATLEERIRAFGTDNPAMRDWIQAQDQVFANCAGGPASAPQPAAAALPAVFRADRRYQIAAAYFYSGQYAEAQKNFQEIAADSASPWKGIAPYLAVRALIRQGTVGAGLDQPPNMDILRRAEQQLQKLPPDLAVQRLRAYLKVRIDPAARAHELALSLMKKNAQETLHRDLWDYTVSLDKIAGDASEQDDLTEWIFLFQSDQTAAFDASLSKWKATSSLPWLVCAISKATSSSPAVADLLAAAEKVHKESPAYLTISFHAARLLSDSGKAEAARRKLDVLLADTESMPRSAINRFLALRFKVAADLDEFLKFAQRIPAAAGIDDTGLEMVENAPDHPPQPFALLVDEDGAGAINTKLPLEWMEQAARNKSLDETLRKRLMRAVWVRSVVLNRTDIAKRLVPDVQPLVPDSADLFKSVSAEPDPVSARFAALYLLLKNPGLEPQLRAGLERETALNTMDSLRDNWWCAPQMKPSADVEFLNNEAKEAAMQEFAALVAAGPAPNFLGAEVIRWARAHREDPKVPEALHLVVKATRYGCANQATRKLSKEAFEILHKDYPNNEWTRKTPYYY